MVQEAHRRVREERRVPGRLEELERLAAGASAPLSFAAALRRPTVAIVAEVKRRSPSRGSINERLDAGAQALAYAEGGAAAVSVLTEPAHFGGAPEDLVAAAAAKLPLLRKDFIVDEIQIVEARALGAAAVLLIARALAPDDLDRLVRRARALLLEPLVEVRNEGELERALRAGAGVIGVNARDLETLEVHPEVMERLVPRVPAGCVAIAESGVRSAVEVRRAAQAGADAVLVGSSLSGASDPTAAVRSLTAIPRVPRRG